MNSLLPPSDDGDKDDAKKGYFHTADAENPLAGADQPPEATDRDRRKLASEAGLSIASLIGSWFHTLENGTIIWAGLVVAEVQPGKYLCQVTKGLAGNTTGTAQLVFDLERMLARDEGYEFRFYDREDVQVEAFVEYDLTEGGE